MTSSCSQAVVSAGLVGRGCIITDFPLAPVLKHFRTQDRRHCHCHVKEMLNHNTAVLVVVVRWSRLVLYHFFYPQPQGKTAPTDCSGMKVVAVFIGNPFISPLSLQSFGGHSVQTPGRPECYKNVSKSNLATSLL